MQRILIIRFSSIGDIVLTSPVARVLRKKYPTADIRFVTKQMYAELMMSNPYLNGVFLLKDGLKELIRKLKTFNPDLIIDLHHNLRTRILRTQISGKWLAFNKLNVEKWLKVNLKMDRLPNVHIVERYLAALKPLGILNDGLGLDLFLPSGLEPPEPPATFKSGYVALVVGAKYATKQLPKDKLVAICNTMQLSVVLVGGPADAELGRQIEVETAATVWNTCGTLTMLQSAYIIKNSKVVLTHDTGMMHVAAAFNIPTVSIWGNTVPQFGMYPYMPQHPDNYFISEVTGLNCRPCSKIGSDRCPKGHFKCMTQQDVVAIVQQTALFLQGK